MRTGKAGLDLIKEFEGLELEAYRDAVGIWTIGYGHTAAAGEPKPKAGMKITEAEAGHILASDLGQYEAAVSKALKVSPNQNQFDAMVSLCFNIGPKAFTGSSVAKRFNAGNIQGAADAFLLWKKAGDKVLKGLIRRRETERQLFLLPVSETKPATEPPKVDPAPTSPLPPPVPPKPAYRPSIQLVMAVIAALAAIIGGFFGLK